MNTDFWDTIGEKIDFKAFGKKKDIEAKLKSLISEFNATFSVQSQNCDNLVSLDLFGLPLEQKRRLITRIFTKLEDRIYSEKDVSLPDYCIELLRFTDKKLGVAESITGGLIADALISVSGASDVFSEGLVCYSNVAKMNVLSVKPETLAVHTAVSSQTAYEMICGLLNHPYNDYALATTGYAENYGEKNNGGRVYVGVGSRDRVDVHEYKFDGDRNTVRKSATNAALFHLVKKLKGAFDYTR